MQVAVYSRCDSVRLELNGKVIGEKPVSAATKLTAKFDVPYDPGELRAIGLINGKVVANTTLKTTAGEAAPADRRPLRRFAPTATTFPTSRSKSLTRPARLFRTRRFPSVSRCQRRGRTGRHRQLRAERRFQLPAPLRKTYQGRCLAILRPKVPPGKITLKAEADGCRTAMIVGPKITIETALLTDRSVRRKASFSHSVAISDRRRRGSPKPSKSEHSILKSL